ncbi:MAG: hypothetical protein IPN34_21080 [Planctomycetes bacterium]|nr:hypothetical protein [Planctomycetota bacterium]
MPVPDLDASTAPDGLPAELAQSWSTATASLTNRELSAVVLRFGFRSGRPESFAAIGREFGADRVRAQAIFTNTIQRLGAQDETRGLARYLADLNAVLSEEEPAVRASRPVPVIEDIDEVVPDDGEDEPEPVSARHALKLVHAADCELARAIEQCVGREDLSAELQRARTRIAAGLREIEQTPPVPAAKQVSSPTGKRRSRPANVQETARRAAVLGRVQAREISNAEAAGEIGIAWQQKAAQRPDWGSEPCGTAACAAYPASGTKIVINSMFNLWREVFVETMSFMFSRR